MEEMGKVEMSMEMSMATGAAYEEVREEILKN